jgi:hypothetical protein
MSEPWTAEVYPSSGFAVFSATGSGMFPAELDEGNFDNRFHELWLALDAGEAAPDWSFQRLVEHRNAPADGRFLRFRQPDGGVFTFRFRQEVPDDRLDLWLAERLTEYEPPIDLPITQQPEPLATEQEPKENDNAQELGDQRHDLPASGGRPEGPEWVWQPKDRPQDPSALPCGQPRRGRGRPRKQARVDA